MLTLIGILLLWFAICKTVTIDLSIQFQYLINYYLNYKYNIEYISKSYYYIFLYIFNYIDWDPDFDPEILANEPDNNPRIMNGYERFHIQLNN